MAKIDAVPGIEVDIISNGAVLPEYPNDDDEGVLPGFAKLTVSRYIESEAESEFIFQFTVKPPYKHDCDYLGFYISIDGEDLDIGQLCGPGHLDEGDSWIDTVSGIEQALRRDEEDGADRYIFTKFKFNEISTTSENGSLSPFELGKLIPNLGLLEIRVLRVKEEPVISRVKLDLEKHNETKKDKERHNVLSEKALKGRAISRSILFEDEQREESLGEEWQHPTFIDGKDNPIAIFRLKCRSRDDLLKEHIIPAPHSKSASPPPRFEDLSDEQRLECARIRYQKEENEAATARLMARIGRKDAASPSPPRRAFQELPVEEIAKLGRERYLESIKPALNLKEEEVVKKEKRSRTDFEADLASPTPPTLSKKTLRKKSSREKVTIDLTSDDDDEQTSFKSVSRSKSAQANSSSSRRPPRNHGSGRSTTTSRGTHLAQEIPDSEEE